MRVLALTALFSTIGLSFGWETVEDAARLSRELVKRESMATLATVYPSDYHVAGLAGHPFALMEYYASCHKNGSLSYLFFPISQNARNVASAPGNTASFTIRVAESPNGFEPDVGGSMGMMDPGLMAGDDSQVLLNARSGKKNPVTAGWRGWGKSIFGGSQAKATGRGPAAAARVALMGNVTVFYGVTGEGDTEADREAREMSDCFLARHPDAKWWVPGRPGAPHVAWWARFDPQAVFYVGGFGSEHYIGWIPLDLYRSGSTEKEYF
ncbi:hypothetical protein RSOLAG22IIIB_05740 [Rhizoctonia solani]|uniref:CREG-like beta-barrel domain-containing protein n=1 Tax=Rhizoctonia solani TaxID=456999 RepID=A0A0K6G884_9AGAM|nr:hypothetical protein RSOLAG22IIIB_05740 [Rhizoctonia solani]